jgi:histidine ammonia-lyase
MEVMRDSRHTFMRPLELESDAVVYGVTTGYGQMAKQRLDVDQRRSHAARPPLAAAGA